MKLFFNRTISAPTFLATATLAGLLLLWQTSSSAAEGGNFNDGIPNAWRAQYFGPDFAADPRAVATADPDGDGANNYLEYITGTHPLGAGSVERRPLRVSTHAGSSLGWRDGSRTDALLNYPRDLAFDPQGRLWFTENGYTSDAPSHRIRIISNDGTISTLTGAAEAGDADGPLAVARFDTPQSPIFDSHGNAYIADLANHRVRMIRTNGIVSTFAGSTLGYRNGVGTNAQFYTVQSICIDASDNIYVADWDNICIRKITPAREVSLFAGQPSVRGHQDGPRLQATFETPGHMVFARNGNMFLTDWANGLVRVIDTNGLVSTFAGGLQYAHRLTLDDAGNVYVTWGTYGPITYLRKYKPDASVAWTIGGTYGFLDGPIDQAEFTYAFSPALLPNGNIIITDELNNRIRVVEMGVPALLAITGQPTFMDSTTVTINTLGTEADVRFTLDGSEPTASARPYAGPFTLTLTTTVKARLFVNGTPVSDIVSATFRPAEVAPVIVEHPSGQTVEAGSTASLSVVAKGTAPLSFQWQFNGASLANETNSTLALDSVRTPQMGGYSVIVANAFGSVTSEVARLTVVLPPARVSAATSSGVSGASITLPIQLAARGDENALGFSLNFDPALLTTAGVSLDSNAPPEATIVVNLDEASSGRIGVLVTLPANKTFPTAEAQSDVLLLVKFQAAIVSSATEVPIFFGDEPTLRQVSDIHATPLPAEFNNGSIILERVPFEGDVAPRPDGGARLSVIDWVQLGRFVAALDEPLPGEFQRADCAPRSTLGDGLIAVTDWVQAGRYAAGLDPLTSAGGPTAPVSPSLKEVSLFPAASARSLAIPGSKVAPHGNLSVPVRLNAQGNENAFGFSVLFDASKLTFQSAIKGAAANNAILNINASQAASGTIGLALALPTGMSIASGTQEIVWLNFEAAANAAGNTGLSFADRPVGREVSTAEADALPSTYAGGAVTFEAPPGPKLQITRSGGLLVLFWNASATDFELQSSDALGGTWSRVNVSPVEIGGQNVVTLPVTGRSVCYRLRK